MFGAMNSIIGMTYSDRTDGTCRILWVLAYCHDYTYMCNHGNEKKRDLELSLKSLGWWQLREGGNHEIWTNGKEAEPIPRHREIAESLAVKIIRKAKAFPGNRR